MDVPKNRKAGRLASPDHLSDTQRIEWDRVVAVLDAATVNAHQFQVIEAYVVERVRWLDAERYLQEHGTVLTLRTDRGDPKQIVEAPQVKIAERAQDRMIKLSAQLGLTRYQAGAA